MQAAQLDSTGRYAVSRTSLRPSTLVLQFSTGLLQREDAAILSTCRGSNPSTQGMGFDRPGLCGVCRLTLRRMTPASATKTCPTIASTIASCTSCRCAMFLCALADNLKGDVRVNRPPKPKLAVYRNVPQMCCACSAIRRPSACTATAPMLEYAPLPCCLRCWG